MSGFGSGSWWSGRPTTSACRPLDIRQLRRRDLLAPGLSFGWHWSQDDEAKIASQFRAKQRGQWKDAAATAGGGWLTLCPFTALTGWIVRGFMGIRGGKDSRDG